MTDLTDPIPGRKLREFEFADDAEGLELYAERNAAPFRVIVGEPGGLAPLGDDGRVPIEKLPADLGDLQLRADLADGDETFGTSLISHRGVSLAERVEDIADQAYFGYGPTALNTITAVNYALDFLLNTGTDDRGETYANGLRRSIKLRRVAGSAVELSPELSSDSDETYSGRLNSTAIGFYLTALCAFAAQVPSRAGEVRAALNEAAQWLIALQWRTPGVARYGGIRLAPDAGQCSCFGTAIAGRALMKAYAITKNGQYLTAARRAADFLMVLKEPNATYQTLYGVTPIPSYSANGTTFTGFCDQIDAADVISLTSTSWNAAACVFLMELGALIGQASYATASADAVPFYTTPAQAGYDFFSIAGATTAKSNVRWVINNNLDFGDNAWHRMGEYSIASTNLTGTLAGATSGTVTLPAAASAVDGAYVGQIIQLTSGPGYDADTNYTRRIVAYTGATKVATLDRAYTITPDATTGFKIGIAPMTVGTDQIEYPLWALHECGYDTAALATWLAYWTSLPNADAGTFGTSYDGSRCLAGYVRVDSPVYAGASKAFGTYYDSVGAAILLKLKQDVDPIAYAKARNMCLLMPQRGALLDENFNTIYGVAVDGVESATKGTLPVAEAMTALLETIETAT